MVKRRSSYDIVCLVLVQLLINPYASVYEISNNINVKWETVDKILNSLDHYDLYDYAKRKK